MRHPTDGTLRRLVDEPAGVADADREHVAGCPVCLAGLTAARQDAEIAGAALRADETADVEAGWQRLSRAAAEPRRTASAVKPTRWRAALRSPVVAGVAVVAILAGAGAAAAADWLPIFHTERVAAITIGPSDLARLPDLSAYGELKITQEPRVREVGSAEAARMTTGLAVPRVRELPRGVTGQPSFQVGDKAGAVFTFSVAKAAQTAKAAGKPLPPPPPGLDGSQFRLTAGPGLAAVWPEARGVPAMVVARAVAPTGFSSGIPFTTARDYLLSLPGLPPSVASQLRAFSANGTTLPLIVKAGEESARSADVNGLPATVLTLQNGSMAGVIWVDHGFVNVVGGSLSADEVLSVARDLRWGRVTAAEAPEQLLADLPPSPAAWCSGLRKRYRRRTAVDDVSFTVGRGEVMGLLGPNGAGKTSVIKMLLGLVRPDAGEVLLLGRPGGDPRSRARVGYLPELFRYQPWLTAAEVLGLHVRLAGVTVPAAERQESLALVGLADRAGDRVGGFSKGMQQRLGLAVALVARPELIILDEPTSALDPIGRADVRDLLLSLKARGVAVLLNSHLIGEVERVCDRVVILDHGKVAAAGTLAELLGRRELRMRLDGVGPRAEERLAAAGGTTREGDSFVVALPADPDESTVPDLVRDLVGLGVRVHSVEPGRISLEERLLDILRTGNGGDHR